MRKVYLDVTITNMYLGVTSQIFIWYHTVTKFILCHITTIYLGASLYATDVNIRSLVEIKLGTFGG